MKLNLKKLYDGGPIELNLEFMLPDITQFGLDSQFGIELSNDINEKLIAGI